MAVALRSLALLSVTGASLALFLQELIGAWVQGFVSGNLLSLPNRHRLLVCMALGAAAGLTAGFVAMQTGTARLRRLSHLLAPGIMLGLVPPLAATSAWSLPLDAALAIAVFVLLGERLTRMSFGALAEPTDFRAAAAASPPLGSAGRLAASLRALAAGLVGFFPAPVRRWGPLLLVAACALGYGIYMSVFTLRMHGRFQTYNYDLGQYDNIFWSTLHGHPLRDAPLGLNKDWFELRNHAELSVFFFLPLYAIRPGGPILLVIQSCMLGLGAIPLYRFAARKLPRGYAAVIAIAYLFYPPMHGLQFYDFHFQPVAATFVLFVIDFVDERRYWLCGLAFVIAIGCREDISVGLALLGTFLALSGHRVRAGLIMAAAGTAYFVAMRFFIMPSFGSWGFQDVYKDLFPPGSPTFAGIIATMISNPSFTFVSLMTAEKLRYALQILGPVAFLPLRRTALAVAVIPGSIFTLLTTHYPPTIDIGFQYSGHFIPYLFPAAVLAIAAYGTSEAGLPRRRAALGALVTGTALCSLFWGAIPPRTTIKGGFGTLTMRAPTDAERQRDRDMKELNALVPASASVAVSEAEMTHISRLEMKGLRDTTDADYLLYAIGSGYGGSTNADRVLGTGEFERMAERPGLALVRRKATTPPPPGSLKAPPASPPPSSQTPPSPAQPMGPLPPTPRRPTGLLGPGAPYGPRPPPPPASPAMPSHPQPPRPAAAKP